MDSQASSKATLAEEINELGGRLWTCIRGGALSVYAGSPGRRPSRPVLNCCYVCCCVELKATGANQIKERVQASG